MYIARTESIMYANNETVILSHDSKTRIIAMWDFFIVQSVACTTPLVERFDTLDEAKVLYNEITLENIS